ncbi:hypothetical protein [Desertivirga xinjiangensis]|uniref:hypothetical protein n=1 Tax=Desertivirga xinjiangensis TaxID=539206 RepID=UPI00210B7BC1|nr:hypothetical protein [Pedobacter xinjiangensis]
MYGQTPYLINAGLQYAGERLGLSLAYNKSSYKTYTVSSDLSLIEYEGRNSGIAQGTYSSCIRGETFTFFLMEQQ